MTANEISILPVSERLRQMEILWDSFRQDDAGDPPSPDWHGAVLDERARALTRGDDVTSPWEDAKKRIREKAEAGK